MKLVACGRVHTIVATGMWCADLRKFLNFQTPTIFMINTLKFNLRLKGSTMVFYLQMMKTETANSEDPDVGLHCLPICLSENLGPLW